MNRLTLLIIDDNQDDCQRIKDYLTASTDFIFTFIEADSLGRAWSLIPHHDLDAVLLDLELPDSNGLDTLRKVATTLPDTAVIVLTSLSEENLAPLTVYYGAQDFLDKRHLTPSSLQKSLKYALERKRFLQEKNDLLHDLNDALEKISTLESYLPLCRGCSKILGDDDIWYPLVNFKGQHSVKKMNQTLCPDCKNGGE